MSDLGKAQTVGGSLALSNPAARRFLNRDRAKGGNIAKLGVVSSSVLCSLDEGLVDRRRLTE